jgi:hypothetical protein
MRLALAAFLIVGFAAANASAIVITDSTGAFTVGLALHGELHDGIRGMRRNADGFDPINPGTPRDSWGVSVGTTAGWANHTNFGVVNIVANGAPVVGPNTASISSFLNPGSGNLLQIDQNYSFVAPNVLSINTKLTNVSAATQAVKFSRNTDWDIAPTLFNEIITVNPLVGPVSNASFSGFENPNPLVPYHSSSGPGGGTFGTGDLGAAYQLSFTLGSGGTTAFTSFYALNTIGQTEAGLRTQLAGLGATFIATGRNSGPPVNFAALAFGPATALPIPGTLSLLGIGLVGLVASSWRRRT